MPIAEFKLKDGRIAQFNMPEGSTPEQAHEAFAAHFSQPDTEPVPQIPFNTEKPQQQTTALEAAAHGAGNFGTAGFADELLGAGNAAMGMALNPDLRAQGWNANYTHARDAIRHNSDVAWDEHPLAYGAGATVGAIVSPINKVGAGLTTAKQGAVLGGIYGAGNVENMHDVPAHAGIGMLGGMVGGKVLDSAGTKLGQFRDNALVNTTNDVADNATTQLYNTLRGGVPADSRDGAINASKQAVTDAYRNLDNLAANADTIIVPKLSAAALDAVNRLDNTALNQLDKNEVTFRGVKKALDILPMTAEESATLHQHLGRITGVDSETRLALKNAQKALGADINASGNADLSAALDNASQTYAKDKSLESLNKLIERHTVQTENGAAVNFSTLANGLKNWGLSKEGAKALKFTPGLKDGIVNLQALINAHPELKSVIANHQAHSILADVFGNSLPSMVKNNLGGLVGLAVGGPPGAVAGEAAQLAARGIGKGTSEIAKHALQSRFYEPGFRADLEASVAPTFQNGGHVGESLPLTSHDAPRLCQNANHGETRKNNLTY